MRLGALILMICISGSVGLQAQQYEITKNDSLRFNQLERLTLPEGFQANRDELPAVVDNSTTPYFRPIFAQNAWSCGQASGISYNFTYEICRLNGYDATLPEYQFPSHYTWNFLNSGYIACGVSLFDAWEIAKTNGCVTVEDYGGMWIGNETEKLWISGYDKYYHGMKYRLKDYYRADLSTEEGLMIMKQWLYNHLDGSQEGGLANILIGSSGPYIQLIPEGLPEENKHIVLGWGEYAGHQITIVGYNDSVRYDVNQDGRYTNHEDITGDGIVDMRDWEIGAWKVANSYGTDWCDEGFAYMQYRLGALQNQEFGVWNKAAFVLRAKPLVDPLLTAKIELKHTARGKIKVMLGVSADPNAISPDHILEFPLFNYQGGNYYMQGGYMEEDKYLEFGLDISPLLSYVNNNQEARFFLMVDEDDPEHEASGKIVAFSLMDYTNGLVEVTHSGNTDLIENDLTQIYLNHQLSSSRPEIIDTEVDPLVVNEPFEYQFSANGGTPPYQWFRVDNYIVQQMNDPMPAFNGTQLSPQSADVGWDMQELDFEFPFYGEMYNELGFHTDGLLMMADEHFEWSYAIMKDVVFKSKRNISPFYSNLYLNYEEGDRMWYEGNEDYAMFKMQASAAGALYETEVNFLIKLYPSGMIEFFYGDMQIGDTAYISGISGGYPSDYVMLNEEINQGNMAFRFIPIDFPEELTFTENGELLGTPLGECPSCAISVKVVDNNGVFSQKTFPLSSEGLLFNCQVSGQPNNNVEYGSEVELDVNLSNISPDAMTNINMHITSESEYISLLDADESLASIGAGENLLLSEVFEIKLSEDVPDNENLLLQFHLESDQNTFEKVIVLKSMAPAFELGSIIIVDDNNGRLDPGETATIRLPVRNIGGANAMGINAELFSEGELIIPDGSPVLNYGDIAKGAVVEREIVVNVNEYAPLGTHEQFRLLPETSNEVTFDSLDFELKIGRIPVLIVELDPLYHSGENMKWVLEEMNLIWEYKDVMPVNLHEYESVFLILGTFFNHYILSEHQGEALAEYLNTGGNLYMEGRVSWSEDPPTDVHSMFGISNTQVPWYNIDTIVGEDTDYSRDMEFEYFSANYFHNNYFVALPPAYGVFKHQDNNFHCVVFNETENYNTIASNIEFSALADTDEPSTQETVFRNYLKFFGIEESTLGTYEYGSMSMGLKVETIYPNPFRDELRIDITTAERGKLLLDVIDVYGRKVHEIASEQVANGKHVYLWNANNNGTGWTQDGIYFIRITFNDQSIVKKVILSRQ